MFHEYTLGVQILSIVFCQKLSLSLVGYDDAFVSQTVITDNQFTRATERDNGM